MSSLATSKSQLTDLKEERKGVALATFGSFTAAVAYLSMMMIALPVSIHMVINTSRDICEGPCFAPTEVSQKVLNNVMLTLRGATFLFGNFLGTLSDTVGRKPLVVGAIFGYAIAALAYYGAQTYQVLELFFVGAFILGATSPMNAHGLTYVSDISQPHRSAHNMGILQGVGYFIGSVVGASMGLAFSTAKTGHENPTIDDYNEFTKLSYLVGFGIAAAGVVVLLVFLPESLHKDEKSPSINWKTANPLGLIAVVTTNPYKFCIWLMATFGWAALGAGESITGGWWLRRYTMSSFSEFVQYLVAVSLCSGFGSIIMTKVYNKNGLKKAVHISSILMILSATFTALAPTVPVSYVAAATTFFSSPVMPCYFALLMGQASPIERGQMGGTMRSSEALGKFLGVLVMGNAFAGSIAPYTPDASCISSEYATSRQHTCECGVESCPQFIDGKFVYVPKTCGLGGLSPTFSSEKGLTPLTTDVLDEFRPEGSDLSDQCYGAGAFTTGGMTVKVNRAWCIPRNDTNPIGKLGCYPEFDLGCTLSCLDENTDDGPFDLSDTPGYCYSSSNETQVDDECAPVQPGFTDHFINETMVALFGESFNGDGVHPSENHCESQDQIEMNLCWTGPISGFPGLIMILLMLHSAVAYAMFLIGETFFLEHDGRYWTTGEVEVTVSPTSNSYVEDDDATNA